MPFRKMWREILFSFMMIVLFFFTIIGIKCLWSGCSWEQPDSYYYAWVNETWRDIF